MSRNSPPPTVWRFVPSVQFLEDRVTPAAFVVKNLTDSGVDSLRGAINALNAVADASNTISFAAGLGGVITLGADLPVVTKSVDIQGPGRDKLAVNGAGKWQIFTFDGPGTTTVSVSGLALTQGRSNRSFSNGGAISAIGENVTLTGLDVNNSALSGGIFVSGGKLVVSDSLVRSNGGDGLGNSNASVTISSSKFQDNGFDGYSQSGGDSTVSDSFLVGNGTRDSSVGGRGATFFGGSATFDRAVVTGNKLGGMSVSVGASSVTIRRTLIANNTASLGGGVFISSGNVNIEAASIVNNVSRSDGGGVSFSNGSNGGSKLTIQNSTITGNAAQGDGGGVAYTAGFSGSVLSIYNSTIAFNQANSTGKGGSGGGVSVDAGLVVALSSSIVARNTAAGLANDVSGNATADSQYNLINVGSGLVDGAGNNRISEGLDPKLLPLADNGGPTQTLALAADSPAVDKGTANGFDTDQRGSGFARVVGAAADIGAFELVPTTVPPTTVPPTTVPPTTVPPTTVPPTTVPPTTVPPTTVPPTTTNPSAASGVSQFAVGPDAGSFVTVKLYNPDGGVRRNFTPFGLSFTGGIRTAAADFNGDGVADVVAGTGPGIVTRVRVLDGVTGAELFGTQPFEDAFTLGVFVAAGDVDGDGVPDLVVTPDQGGGPRVRVFTGQGFTVIADFFAIDDAAFRGGARAAVGDLTGDGVGDLVVSAGFGGGPRVAGFRGPLAASAAPQKAFGDFFAFEQELRNGAYLTAGDLDGDGYAELIAGAGPGGGPRVTAFDGQALTATNTQVRRADFFAGDSNDRLGVRPAVKDLDGDARADLVTASATTGRVTLYPGSRLAAGNLDPLADFDAIPGAAGVFVG